MNYASLHYFVVAAEELHFTRAASKLFMTQQSLSEHIRKLERQYNAEFFERGPRLRLTYQGERMLLYARKTLEAEQELIANLQSDSKNKRVKMKIGQASSRGMVFLPTIIDNFNKKHPNVILSITTGNREYIDSQLHLGNLELYMGMMERDLQHSGCETLYRDKLYYIISKNLLEYCMGTEAEAFVTGHTNGVSISDACRFPISLPPMSSALRIVFEKYFADNYISPNAVLETAEHNIMFDVCQIGLCGCFVSRELLYRKIMHKSMPHNVYYFPALGFPQLSHFNLIYEKKELSEYTADFITCCRETVMKEITEIDQYLSTMAVTNNGK